MTGWQVADARDTESRGPDARPVIPAIDLCLANAQNSAIASLASRLPELQRGGGQSPHHRLAGG